MQENVAKYVDANMYVDARVKVLNSCFFGDEVTLIHEYKEGKDIQLMFSGCCNVTMKRDGGFENKQGMRNATYAQIPYFMQNFEINKEDKEFYHICIDAFPLTVEIICKHVAITMIERINTLGLKCSEFKW